MIESTATVLFLVLLVVIWLACGVLGVLSAGLHGTVGAATFQNDPHGDAIRSRRKGSDAALDGRTMHRHRSGIASGICQPDDVGHNQRLDRAIPHKRVKARTTSVSARRLSSLR